MSETCSNMWLATLDPEWHAKTCDYWYTVTRDSFAHTAFNRRESLMQWTQERGLHIAEPLPEHGQHSSQRIIGTYRREMHWSYDEFYALQGHRTRTLSNGDWTLAIITNDADGIRTVHTLNPNCHDRPMFDYKESRALLG